MTGIGMVINQSFIEIELIRDCSEEVQQRFGDMIRDLHRSFAGKRCGLSHIERMNDRAVRVTIKSEYLSRGYVLIISALCVSDIDDDRLTNVTIHRMP